MVAHSIVLLLVYITTVANQKLHQNAMYTVASN